MGRRAAIKALLLLLLMCVTALYILCDAYITIPYHTIYILLYNNAIYSDIYDIMNDEVMIVCLQKCK